jgi:hypothetical protein
MPNEQIVTIIRSQMSAGIPREAVMQNLRNAGFAETDIALAFAHAATSGAPLPSTPPAPPMRRSVILPGTDIELPVGGGQRFETAPNAHSPIPASVTSPIAAPLNAPIPAPVQTPMHARVPPQALPQAPAQRPTMAYEQPKVAHVPPHLGMHLGWKTILTTIIILILGSLGVGAYEYSNKGGFVFGAKESSSIKTVAVDGDLLIDHLKAPGDGLDIVPIFNALISTSTTIAQADRDFLNKYIVNLRATTTIPLVEAKAVLARNKAYIEAFEKTGMGSAYYHCFVMLGDGCRYDLVEKASQFALLKTYIFFKEKKIMDATKYAERISTLGRIITQGGDDTISLLVGWKIEKSGYDMLTYMAANTPAVQAAQKPSILKSDADAFIEELRESHRLARMFAYTAAIELVDYSTSANKVPENIMLDEESEAQIAEYRKAISKTSWNPDETKSYFTESFRKSIANIDLPCGSALTPTKKNFQIDVNDRASRKNSVGKTFYENTYIEMETLNSKRCEVEKSILALVKDK